MEYSEALKTGLEVRSDLGTWHGCQWYDLFLCGKKVGPAIVGYSRAVTQLKGIANTAGIDLRAARSAFLEAHRDEENRFAHMAQLEGDCPDFVECASANAIETTQVVSTKDEKQFRRMYGAQRPTRKNSDGKSQSLTPPRSNRPRRASRRFRCTFYRRSSARKFFCQCRGGRDARTLTSKRLTRISRMGR